MSDMHEATVRTLAVMQAEIERLQDLVAVSEAKLREAEAKIAKAKVEIEALIVSAEEFARLSHELEEPAKVIEKLVKRMNHE